MSRRTPLRRSRRWARWAAIGTSAVAVIAGAVVATAAPSPHNPIGSFDSLTQTLNGFEAKGWSIDPDTATSIKVALRLDGKIITEPVAAGNRPDIAKSHPRYGAAHGFDITMNEPAGAHTVCMYGINVSHGTGNSLLGCRTITLNYSPRGAIVSITHIPGGMRASGWAADPSAPATALSVAITIDGTRTATIVAKQPRSDVGLAGAGPNHGYTIDAPLAEGTHRICLAVTNIGPGGDVVGACRLITVNYSPIGAITSLSQAPGGFRISGWAADPDSSGPVAITISIGTTVVATMSANQPTTGHGNHGFSATTALSGAAIKTMTRSFCASGKNLGAFGHDASIGCQSLALNFNPTASVVAVAQHTPGARVIGWTLDPDTNDPTSVTITADGKAAATVPANQAGAPRSGHMFNVIVPLGNGTHTICAIAHNLGVGTGDSSPSCQRVTLNFNPYGRLESAVRETNSTRITLTGWAADPDTSGAITVHTTFDGKSMSPDVTAGTARPDVVKAHPGTSANTGFRATYNTSDGEHTVCSTAINVKGGTSNTGLGCMIVNAVHPKAPSAPQQVSAVGGYGGATISWVAPASDGGAPWSTYVVTASPGGLHVSVPRTATSATILGLSPKATYAFKVVAYNVAGASAEGWSGKIVTQASPPPQTSPAPISTSRYIRNVSAATASDLATMRAEGAADAKSNPSGHGYLILLDIGGQDQADGGVVLSATTHFVSYGDLVADVNAYVDGYASAQKPSAPITVAIGTNNDMDVSTSSGITWAQTVVNPVRTHAARYTGVTIAGANDVEPGFRGNYAQSRAWLQGYLSATKAPFVFNGSADGCSWTQPNSGCNNGWSQGGLYYLAGGAAPIRIINLPQVYNNDMAGQWKNISLTGVNANQPKINFGGALTEWTACVQVGDCGSLTGTNAWKAMWAQLQSIPVLKIASLPYSTDLRIDR